jgi:hypothetical protein
MPNKSTNQHCVAALMRQCVLKRETLKMSEFIGNVPLQAKDIENRPILEFLSSLGTGWGLAGFGLDPLPANSVAMAMPAGTRRKLGLAKMGQLIKRGLVSGCACGCRGGFKLTDKGRQALAAGSQ